MEDLPDLIREKIEQYSKEQGFSDIMIVDAHNALGKKIPSEEETILCDLALSSLKKLKTLKYHSYGIGYANSTGSESTMRIILLVGQIQTILLTD